MAFEAATNPGFSPWDMGSLSRQAIIRIDTRQIRAAGCGTQGVKLLDLEQGDKGAAAMTIPPEDPKTQPENGTLI